MKKLTIALFAAGLLLMGQTVYAQDSTKQTTEAVVVDSSDADMSIEEMIGNEDMAELAEMAAEDIGMHQELKNKFIEGDPRYMSLVAIVLIIGLALCIERIIYLTRSEVNTKKLLSDIEKKVESSDVEGAKTICRNTRGPVASVCYQGLMHINESAEDIERSIISYGTVLTSRLERGCSWIKLCIAIAPSLGFLGTVIGMVMAFDQIQAEGDISPTIVAEGMKVALITTIFGIIVALILQVFYNFVNSRIDRLTTQMEEGAINLMDIFAKVKAKSEK
ncbi:MotA/TolQ/ExbB proton channel family protein [Prevotella communis]|jgi:biopolymer transport protein ExbB|uniref:Biopolymer transport protein ExbB n=1 Tax=Prevotella communis TaxID=2913614 RepID=A0A1H0HD43_9BACT|nr:MotA/TolQ/ExbB proton channel family protein [Prevotella communis]UKK55644.1 MotA/TolQ/ExbB proton channel family protein [Prevotella communis]UKK61240.1 MotA/TolQ/ExbB proton channel family protein [Prevotella communis]UKK64065.1 MotA/TolQ/ExbB proton channel family protein [Prevotella communis]SDG73120.1 biopolymer transport protein ExbB [Prevotella communis]SDO16781.1 biopolymer transport protein ExbB [Prevotella communis]